MKKNKKVTELKLNIGDKVRVKSLNWFEEFCYIIKDDSFGFKQSNDYLIVEGNLVAETPVFNKRMICFCENTVTIKKIINTKNRTYYRIEEDNGKDMWSLYMFDTIFNPDYRYRIINYCRSQCIYNNSDFCNNCKLHLSNFKESAKEELIVGDKVRIKSLDWFSIYYYPFTGNYLLSNTKIKGDRLFLPISFESVNKFSGKLVKISMITVEKATGCKIYRIEDDMSNSRWLENSFITSNSIDYTSIVKQHCNKCITKDNCNNCFLKELHYI